MYRYCDGCEDWRHSTYLTIEEDTRNVICGYCETWVRGELSDYAYMQAWKQHAMKVPAPESMASEL